jgi:multimeric flavodoxin WrbA
MKVVAFNGSPMSEGNTAILINHVFSELDKEGIRCEMVQVGGTPVRGCINCGRCFETHDKRCALGDDDIINECIKKMLEADAVILGSPTYFANLTPEIKALIDRAGMVAKANEDMFKRKVGASVVAVRRGGAIHVFDSLNHFFFISQMIVPGSSYWNIGYGLDPGQVEEDYEGIETMKTLGRNMAWLLKKLNGENVIPNRP